MAKGSAGAPRNAAAARNADSGSTDSAPRRRRPPEIRRAMIIEAARGPIADKGMHGVTIRDIAAAAHVAVGTVTYHFSGIAEVLAGVLEVEMTEFSAPVMALAGTAPTGRAALAVLTEGLLADGDRAAQHWRLWLDFWTLSAHQRHYSDWQSQVYRDLHALAGVLIGRGIADGSLPRATEVERHAIEYVALMDGLVVQAYLPDARLTPATARDLLTGYVTRALG